MTYKSLLLSTALLLMPFGAQSFAAGFDPVQPVLMAQATDSQEVVKQKANDKAARKAARAAKKAKRKQRKAERAAAAAGKQPKPADAKEAEASPGKTEPARKAKKATKPPKSKEPAPQKVETGTTPKTRKSATAKPKAPAKAATIAKPEVQTESVSKTADTKPKPGKKAKTKQVADPGTVAKEAEVAPASKKKADAKAQAAAKRTKKAAQKKRRKQKLIEEAENSGDSTTKNSAASKAAKISKPVDEPPAVIKDDQTREEKARLAVAERKRRKEKKRRRNELIGAAAAGVAVGVIVNELGGKVVGDEGDRLVVEREGRYFVRKDENERLRNNGARIRNEELSDGRMRTIVQRRNGVQVITERDAGGFILRRFKVLPNGDRIILVDDRAFEPSESVDFRRELPPLRVGIDRRDYVVETGDADRERLLDTLQAQPVENVERAYTLREIRDSERLRAKVRRIDLDTITFDTGSYSLTRSQVDRLGEIGGTIEEIVKERPREVFLIEGHTDAVGDELSNLTLSDRRAETIARILTDNFDVPPENMVVQGYGEQYLKIDTGGNERANRRVTVRRITPLLSASR